MTKNDTTVLLVEDEALIALAEERILTRNGLSVVHVSTGEDAVSRVGDDPGIDIVLMDINLGRGIDGTEAARRILALRELPIVFLTSHAEKEFVDRVKAITRYGYVLKNSGEFVLLEAIAMARELFEAHGIVHRKQEEAEHAGERLRKANIELETRNQQLREAEANRAWADRQYRLLFTHMTSGFALHDVVLDSDGSVVDYRFLDVNPAYEALTGLTASRVIGKTVLEVLPEVERTWIEAYGRVALTGESIQFEDYSGALDKYFLVTAFRPMTNQFAVIVEDGTERRRAVERIREREQFLDGVIRTSRDGYWEADLSGVIVDANDGYCTTSGYRRDELVGMHISSLDANERPADTAAHVEQIRRDGAATFETVHQRKDGTTFDVEVSARFMDSSGGRIVVFVRDISDRKRFEEAQRREIEERTYLLQEFSHRVKNNLAMISSLIAMKGASLEGAVDLSDIQRQVRAIEVLHEKLLVPGVITEIDLKDYIEGFLTDVVSFGACDSIAVEQRIDRITVPTRMAVTVGLLVTELVTNAMKHGFDGASEKHLHVACASEGKWCRLTVSNSGQRLPEEFDPSARHTLGMRLITALVDQLDGELSIERDPLTSFGIRFPLDTTKS